MSAKDWPALVAAVEALTAERHVWTGGHYTGDPGRHCYVDARAIRFDSDLEWVTPNVLRRAARAGLVHPAPGDMSSRYWAGVTSLAHGARIVAELALTPEERAERTAAYVRGRYAENRVRNSDWPAGWAADTDLGAFPTDGIVPALDLGLIREDTRTRSWSNKPRYVPGECFDAWLDAVDRAEALDARLDAARDAAVARVVELVGDGDHRERRVELTAGQVERLLALLPPPPKPHGEPP